MSTGVPLRVRQKRRQAAGLPYPVSDNRMSSGTLRRSSNRAIPGWGVGAAPPGVPRILWQRRLTAKPSKAGQDCQIPPFWNQRCIIQRPNPTRSVVSAACMLRRPRSRSGSCVAVPACPNVAMSGTQGAPPTVRASAVLSVGIVKHNAESSPAACRTAGRPHETHAHIHDRKELHNVITSGRALGRPQT